MAVLFYVISSTLRPTTRDETILHGYVNLNLNLNLNLNKFHDREPAMLLATC